MTSPACQALFNYPPHSYVGDVAHYRTAGYTNKQARIPNTGPLKVRLDPPPPPPKCRKNRFQNNCGTPGFVRKILTYLLVTLAELIIYPY
jgi:hypothetical protein